MSFQKRHSQLFQAVFITVVVILLVTVIRSLYYKASTPDDENLFRTTPGSILVTEQIEGRLYNEEDPNSSTSAAETVISVGEIVRSVDGEVFRQLGTLEAYLTGLDSLDELTFQVFDPRDASTRNIIVYYGNLPQNAFRGISSSVYVITVFEDGASERAGLRVGDLIVSINEKYFKNMHDADRILKEARSEKKLAYDIIRGKENLTVEITLATVGLHLPVLIFFFSGLIMMLIGGFVGVSRPQFIAARYLGMAYVVTGFFIAFMEAQRTIKDDFVEVRAIFLIIAIFLSIPLWLHAIHYFPLKHEGLLKRPWVRNVSYALAALAAIWTLFVNDRYVPFFLLLLLVYNALVQFVFRKQASPEYNEINSLIKRFNNIAMIGTFLTIAYLIYTHWGSMDRAANKYVYVGIHLALLPI